MRRQRCAVFGQRRLDARQAFALFGQRRLDARQAFAQFGQRRLDARQAFALFGLSRLDARQAFAQFGQRRLDARQAFALFGKHCAVRRQHCAVRGQRRAVLGLRGLDAAHALVEAVHASAHVDAQPRHERHHQCRKADEACQVRVHAGLRSPPAPGSGRWRSIGDGAPSRNGCGQLVRYLHRSIPIILDTCRFAAPRSP